MFFWFFGVLVFLAFLGSAFYCFLKSFVWEMTQAKKNKKLFWISAIAPLLSVIISTLCIYLTRADLHGVKIVSSYYLFLQSTQMLQSSFEH